MEPENLEKPEKKPEDLVKTFKDYFKKILSFKFAFTKYYFRKKMPQNKYYADINLEIILWEFRKFMGKYNLISNIYDEGAGDSSMDSPGINTTEPPKSSSPKEKDFVANLYKFESIIEVLINIGPYEMFREVKSMILTEFESTTSAIQKYLEKMSGLKELQVFVSLTQKILFIVSFIVFKLDSYTISVNCLVEKLNRFFIDFVTRAKDAKQNNFVRCLNLVQKFIKIKKNYMTDFMTDTNKKDSMFNFAFNKFCSFGRYFFSNLYLLLDNDITLIPRISRQRAMFRSKGVKDFSPRNGGSFMLKKTFTIPRQSKSQTCITKFLEQNDLEDDLFTKKASKKRIKLQTVVRRRSRYGKLNPELDKLFKIYFISKLANWKYVSINTSGLKKEEICRICEKTYKIDNFILHVFYCKEQKLYIQNFNELRGELNKCLEKLNKYKE
jgi:hypothetical protein